MCIKEGSQIDHAVLAIQALESGHRGAVMAKVSVVIVYK